MLFGVLIHTGLGKKCFGFIPEGIWETPCVILKLIKNLLMGIVENDIISMDFIAHSKEHSIEVILPILKFLNSSVSILPFCIKQLSLSLCDEIADIFYKSFKTDNEILLLLLVLI